MQPATRPTYLVGFPQPLHIRSNQTNLQFIQSRPYFLSPSMCNARYYIPFNSNGCPRVIDLTFVSLCRNCDHFDDKLQIPPSPSECLNPLFILTNVWQAPRLHLHLCNCGKGDRKDCDGLLCSQRCARSCVRVRMFALEGNRRGFRYVLRCNELSIGWPGTCGLGQIRAFSMPHNYERGWSPCGEVFSACLTPK